MNRLKNISIIFLLLSFLFSFIISCDSTNPKPPEKPPGYQEDIPWPSLADSPWPSFQYDLQNTGRSQYTGPLEGKIKWKYELNFGVTPAFITINENNTILLTYNRVMPDPLVETSDYLLAFSSNGDLVWYQDLCFPDRIGLDEISAAITNSEGVIYVGSSCGKLLAIDQNQTVQWEFDAGSAIINGHGGISIDKNGDIYISTIETFLKISKSGSLIWKNDDYKRQQAVFSPNGKVIYMKSRNGTIDAVDLDGEVKWAFPFSTEDFIQYIICDSQGNIYFSYQNTFYSVDSEGVTRWKYSVDDSEVLGFSTPTIDKLGNLFFNTNASLYSLSFTGELRWIIDEIKNIGSHPICDASGNIYQLADQNLFSIANDGSINWSIQFETARNSNTSLALGMNSDLYLIIEKNGYSELYSIK